MRTFGIVIDLSMKYPTKTGISRLKAGIEKASLFCENMQIGDLAIFDNEVHQTCARVKSAMSKYRKKISLIEEIKQTVNNCLYLKEDTSLFVVTDQFKDWMNSECEFIFKQGLMNSKKDFEVFICSVGKEMIFESLCVKKQQVEDVSLIDVVKKDERRLSIDFDCSPLEI